MQWFVRRLALACAEAGLDLVFFPSSFHVLSMFFPCSFRPLTHAVAHVRISSLALQCIQRAPWQGLCVCACVAGECWSCAHALASHTCSHARMHACTHARMHGRMHTHSQTCAHVSTGTYTNTYSRAHIQIYMTRLAAELGVDDDTDGQDAAGVECAVERLQAHVLWCVSIQHIL